MTKQTLKGSCLCGAVQFVVTGEPVRFFHCHCSRCRKSTGTGHASNVFISNGKLTCTGDLDHVKTYKLPDAQRFARTFCTHCGGPLPREMGDSGQVFVPAGTLDDEPNIKPQARIFQDSKASWSCSGDEVPCFARYAE
ncbi:MAG: GFA family protein [Halieaceae bacterium]|nr:GFA family protein [Halieaceae bacterium]